MLVGVEVRLVYPNSAFKISPTFSIRTTVLLPTPEDKDIDIVASVDMLKLNNQNENMNVGSWGMAFSTFLLELYLF